MTALTDLRALVRRDLKDEDDTNYRWTDDEIDRAIEKAVLDYSDYCPLQQKTPITTTGGSAEVDISTLTDLIQVLQVEHPIGENPRQFHYFKVWGTVLTFEDGHEGDGEDCNVYWLKKHSIATTSTVPTAHLNIIALGAAAYAISSQAQYQVDMANIGGQKVNKDYNFWSQDAFARFYAALERIKSYSRKQLKTVLLAPEETHLGVTQESD